MPVTMSQLGIEPTEEEILLMAESCVQANGQQFGRAKKLGKEDAIQIYRMAK